MLPLQLNSPLNDLLNPRAPRAPQPPALPPLSPQEEKSLLSSIGGTALEGLGYVGSSLSKAFGGRALRGLIGGRPEELLSVIPFSDALGITDPANEVRGAELLGGGPETELLSAQGLGGLGLEILLDPGTYLTFGGGALTSLGKAAGKAGVLPKTVAGRLGGLAAGSDEAARLAASAGLDVGQVAGQRLGGHVGIGLPFATPAATFDLTAPISAANDVLNMIPGAPTARRMIGDALDPLRRGATALFDKSVMGQVDPALQSIARDVSERTPQALANARGPTIDLVEEASRLAGYAGGPVTADVDDALRLQGQLQRQMLEGTVPTTPEFAPVIQGQQAAQQAALDRLRSVGYADQVLQDPAIGYAPRQAVQTTKGGRPMSAGGATPAGQLAREEILKGLPTEGPGSLNELTSRTDLKALQPIQREAVIRQQYLKMTPADEATFHQLKAQSNAGTIAPGDVAKLEDLEARWVQARGLADWYQTLDTEALAKVGGYFSNHPLLDLQNKLVADELRILKAEAFHRGIASLAVPAGQAGQDAVLLPQLLEQAGLTFNDANTGTGAMYATLKALEKEGKAVANTAGLAQLAVPRDVADSLLKYTKAATTPAGLEPFLKLWDSITNLTKPFQTVFWPANQVRNQTTAFFQNWVYNAFDPMVGGELNPAAYIKPWLDAKAWHEGKVIPGLSQAKAFAGMTDEQATKAFQKMVQQWDVPHRIGQLGQEVVGADPNRLTYARKLEIPGAPQDGFWKNVGKIKDTEINPLKKEFYTQVGGVAGVAGNTIDTFGPIKAGRGVASYLDDINRVSVFIAKLKQGFEPAQAFEVSLRAHYDFSNLSQFERAFGRRVVPFYCVPDDSQILTRDGWKTCDELRTGEEVLTYNVEADRMEWQPCQDKAIFDHDQELLAFKSPKRSFLFTPEHRWPVRVGACTVNRPYGTYAYPESRKVVIGEELRAGQSFILTADMKWPEESLLTPEQARLLGWLVTDGYYRKKRNYTEAVLYQSPKKFLAEATAVAGGRPRKPHPQTGVITIPVDKARKEELLLYLDKTRLVEVVTRLSREAAEAMYDAMYKAEGNTKDPRRAGFFFAGFHPGVVEAFRVLAHLLGKVTKRNYRGCYIRRGRFMKLQSGTIEAQHYKGRVWCPMTPNGTWVMKQNECIIITGNTWMRQNVPAVLREIATKPGGKMGTAVKTSAGARGQEPGFTPDYLGAGIALPIGERTPEGMQRFLSSLGLPFEDIGNLATPTGLLGALNPAIKGPLELATGRQFFTGRELNDLQGFTGSTVADQAIMNSPLSRFFTTARTLGDERKGIGTKALNLLTGARVTDVDMERAKNIAVRDHIEEALRTNPAVRRFERLSVRPEDLASLNPQERALLLLYQSRQRAGQGATGTGQAARAR